MKVSCGAAKAGPVSEVGRVHNQRVAFPVADRIAHPFSDIRHDVLAVHADYTGVVVHLDENHHRIGRLHDALGVVIERGEHGWS